MKTAEDAISILQELPPKEVQKVKEYLDAEEEFQEEDYSPEDIEKILQAGEDLDRGINVEKFPSMKEAKKSLGLTD